MASMVWGARNAQGVDDLCARLVRPIRASHIMRAHRGACSEATSKRHCLS